MDKNKVKEALKKKLKKEMSATGTGASVTPGVGAGVATKYAFGKRDNKGTPKDWKAAPSILNRKSKAMDYKELWEMDINDPILMKLRAIKDTPKPQYQKPNLNQSKIDMLLKKRAEIIRDMEQEAELEGGPIVDEYGEKLNKIDNAIRKLRGLKEDSTDDADYDNDTTGEVRGEEVYDYKSFVGALGGESMNEGYKVGDIIHFKDGEDWKVMKVKDNINKLVIKPHNEKAKENNTSLEIDIDMDYVKKNINEGYAQFRNETKTRTKPEQFHQAVKEVKKKVNEINRLFEYMDRLKSELNEGEEIKYKKYTEKAIQQIKESTKSLFFKSTKLK